MPIFISTDVTQIFHLCSQHVTHLQALLEEHQSVPSSDLHDSGVRTLCICEQQAVDLDKVISKIAIEKFSLAIPSIVICY